MKLIIRHIMCLFVLMMGNIVFAQNSNTIEGIVVEINKDGKEVGLPGANVYWLGTQNGISTNYQGIFNLKRVENSSTLVVSYVGYNNDTINIGDENSVRVLLKGRRDLDEVVIAQKSVGTHISRAKPILTQEITTEELCKGPCCSLSGSFETNASVDVGSTDAVSGSKQIKLLGLAGIYCQLTTENIPNLRGLGTPFGLEYIPVTWMESIQISKGAASVRTGYESITGQINTEYVKPHKGDLLNFNAYSDDLGDIGINIYNAIRFSEKIKTLTFFHYSGGLDHKSDRNNDGFLDQPLVKQINLFNRWDYDYKKVHLKFGVKYLTEDRDGGQLSFDKAKTPDLNNAYGIGIKTNRYEVFAKAAYLFNEEGTTSLGLVSSFIHHKLESFFGLNEYNGVEDNFYGNLMFQTNLGNEKNTVVTGTSLVIDHFNEQLNDSVFIKKENIPGVFVEYSYSDKEKFTIVLGARSDFNNLYGTLFTPRIHMRYNLAENTILRASAGKGYRSTNLIAENIYLLSSSRKLKVQEIPEIEAAWNYGINLTQYFNLFGREVTLNLEFYRTDFQNQLVIDRDQDVSSIYIYNLKGKSYSNTFQIESSVELFNRMDVTIAGRYNDVKITTNDELLREPLSSDFKGLVNLSYATNLKKWQFDFTAQFNGSSRIPNTSMNPQEYQREEFSPKYTILNAQITKYFRNWDLYFACENITNFKQNNPILAADDPFGNYFDASMIWGPVLGRKFYLGIRYRITY